MASDEVKERAKAAVVGSLVADAAGHPLHWVYDISKVQAAVKDKPEPEFNSEWICPYYKLDTGSFSVYADQSFVLLQSLVENQGFNVKKFMEATLKHFGPGTPYDLPQQRENMPKQGPWRNGHITKSLDKMAAGDVKGGVDATESDAYCLVTPLVAMYAGSNQLNSYIEQAVRVTLNNDFSVRTAQFYGRLLEHYILHGKDPDALHKILSNLPDDEFKEKWQVAYDQRNIPSVEAVKTYGAACAIPGNFQGALNGIAKNEDYVTAVRKAMCAGGAIAPRLCAIGACAAAQQGLQAIPASWISRTLRGTEVGELASKLVNIDRK